MTELTPARGALAALPASALILVAAFSAAPAAALDLDCTWTGAGADANWSTPENWSGCADAAPGHGDRLVFPAGPAVLDTVNDLFGPVYANVRFEGAGYTVSGDAVNTNFLTVSAPTSLATDLELVHGAGEHLVHIAADLTVEAGHQLGFFQAPLATSVVSLTNGAVIDAALGGSAERLVLRGDGRFAVRGDGYAGTIALEDGAVLSCGGAECGAATGPLQVFDGSRLEFTGDAGFTRPIELGVDGPANAPGVVAGAHAVTLDGGVDVLASALVSGGQAGALAFTDGISIASGAALELTGANELPAFATLLSAPDAELRVGTPAQHGSLRIAEGQFGHEGATVVTGLGSELVAGDQIALGPVGGAPTIVQEGATLGVDATIVVGEHVLVDGDSRVATVSPGASATFEQLELTAGGRVETLATPSAISLAGVSGAGPLRLFSAGIDAPILFDAGGTSAFTGTTVAETGAIALNRDGAIPGDLTVVDAHVTTLHTVHGEEHDLIADDALVTIDGGELVLNDGERFAALAGAGGSLLLVDAASRLALGGAGDTAWAGAIRGGGALVHDGVGHQRFSGDWAELAGGSRLEAVDGTVSVDGAFAETTATVAGRLQGTGVLGDVVLDGGVLAPGASPGCLAVTGAVGDGPGTIELELGGTDPCAFDRIDAGVQHLAEAEWAVSFVDGFAPEAGQVFAVVRTSGQGDDALPNAVFDVDGVAVERSWTGDEVLLTVAGAGETPTAPGGAGGPAAGPSHSGLADTGAEPAVPAALAMLLLLAGAVAGTLGMRASRAR